MAIRKKYQGQALGRGLDALLNTDAEVQTAGSSNICEVSIAKAHRMGAYNLSPEEILMTTVCRNWLTASGK